MKSKTLNSKSKSMAGWRRFVAVLKARNIEFVRDRRSLAWNIFLPVALVLGLSIVFSGDGKPLYKVGVLSDRPLQTLQHPILEVRHVDYVVIDDRDYGVDALVHHRLDLLVDLLQGKYWVNDDSPNGYIMEKILLGMPGSDFSREQVEGEPIRYIDWLLPGILGMNIMFSCLIGLGYVVVRYRKSGFLKRLKASPLTPLEFVCAQITSRLMLITCVTALVFTGVHWVLDLQVAGSYLLLVLLLLLGSLSLISMGFLVSARISSEELAGGLVNMLIWPMMMLSGVWFSIEGAPDWVMFLAQCLPLTHLLEAARAVMLDGAGITAVVDHIAILILMTLGFLFAGVLLFRWQDE